MGTDDSEGSMQRNLVEATSGGEMNKAEYSIKGLFTYETAWGGQILRGSAGRMIGAIRCPARTALSAYI